jgi:5-methylcytosine-specific restriction enzyme A
VPSRPKRPCRVPGCPATHRNLNGHCDAHQEGAEPQGRRPKDPEQQRFYNSTRWKRLRAGVRAEEPLCRLCLQIERVAPTEIIDHIDGNWRNNERSNLRGLCRPCNDRITGQQHRHKGEGRVESLGDLAPAPVHSLTRAMSAKG